MRDVFVYPIYLSLPERPCLVIGFGNVGMRKLESLLAAGATEATVIDRRPPDSLTERAKALLSHAGVVWRCGDWKAGDIERSFIVFACTDDPDENRKIARCCNEHGKLCNNVTDPEAGNFTVPALAMKPPLACAISTGSGSPYLAAKLKKPISGILAHYQIFALFMKLVRKLALQNRDEWEERKSFFACLCDSPLPELLFLEDFQGARLWIEANLSGTFQKAALAALGEVKK